MDSAAARGDAKKEWRAVGEHSSFRNSRNEDQSDERTIYEEGRGPLDVDFCSITIDGSGGLSDEILQQKLQEIARQREQLQHVEIELRAQAIARTEIMEAQNSFRVQIKEHVDVISQLKEQIQERDQHIHGLELKLEEKDRELRAVKLDNEAAWAKDDLLREQNKELATFRRELDNSEAERAQHLKQIHDLQEHVQEKESQILALEEQHRVAQETVLFKEERLREAQTWIARVQEMDALQSTTLQAEIRERTEQFNQCWIGLQRQFAEVEQHHVQTIHQLQLELTKARERNGIYEEDAKVACQNSTDSTSYVQTKGNQINTNDAGSSNGNLGFLLNGQLGGHSYAPASTAITKTEHATGVAVVPPPILGMGSFIPQNQMTALHPFVMHPQGVPQSVSASNSHPQSHVGHFQPVSTIQPNQLWHHQQVAADFTQNANNENFQSSQTEQNLVRSDAPYSYELPSESKVIHPDHSNTQNIQQLRSNPTVDGSSNKDEVVESNGKQYQTPQEPEQMPNAYVSSQPTLEFSPPELKNEIQDPNAVSTNSENVAAQSEKVLMFSEPASTTRAANPMVPAQITEPSLLDERSLLACIVRAIPAGADGRIRISTTLTNRLAKMLAPLHWHDYKKRYGKLDDFMARYPELFVIEGDFIHLREGAQQIISATTAFAKVAAATASSAPNSSFPSVALTPVAQSNRHKTVPSLNSRPSNTFMEGVASKTVDISDKRSPISKSRQQLNGVSSSVAKELSDMSISVNSKNLQEVDGLLPENRPHSAVQNAYGNGVSKGLSNGRHSSVGKQTARTAGGGGVLRR